MSRDDLAALRLTLTLAASTTLLLLVLVTPLAAWLARGRSRWRAPAAALLTLPLVLPPTVLGFYLLLLMQGEGPLGRLAQGLGLGPLLFHFPGLLIASAVYSLPFVLQPLRQSFAGLDPRPIEAAASLGCPPARIAWQVVLPQIRGGLLAAGALAFAHTLGEFGVVLMVGGNIPGSTRLISLALYDHVEALEMGAAHTMAGVLLLMSFVLLLVLQRFDPGLRR